MLIEHARSGMGIEFIDRDPHHQTRMEALISDLRAQGSVIPEVRLERQNVLSHALNTKPRGAAASPTAPELHDSLLGLILVGTALKRGDFLRELERQRSRSTTL